MNIKPKTFYEWLESDGSKDFHDRLSIEKDETGGIQYKTNAYMAAREAYDAGIRVGKQQALMEIAKLIGLDY